MTIEERLRQMINTEYGSLRAFTMEKNLTYANMDSILRRGIKNATWTSVKKLCEALGISADELIYEKIVPVDKTMKRKQHMTDIDSILAFTKQNLQEYSDLTIEGQPMTKNEIEILLDAIDIGVEIIKRNRKRRMMK